MFTLTADPCCLRPAFLTVEAQLLVMLHGSQCHGSNVTVDYDRKDVINSVGAIQERGDGPTHSFFSTSHVIRFNQIMHA